MATRFIRFPELQSRVGLSRTTIWRIERDGAFPRRRRLGKNSVAWLENEVADWIARQAEGDGCRTAIKQRGVK